MHDRVEEAIEAVLAWWLGDGSNQWHWRDNPIPTPPAPCDDALDHVLIRTLRDAYLEQEREQRDHDPFSD